MLSASEPWPMKRARGRKRNGQCLGRPLAGCSDTPLTGFYRDGCCNTAPKIRIAYGLRCYDGRVPGVLQGVRNDLSTPIPEYEFRGLSRRPLVSMRATLAEAFAAAKPRRSFSQQPMKAPSNMRRSPTSNDCNRPELSFDPSVRFGTECVAFDRTGEFD